MAMVHGCVLKDRAFVGLGAIVMGGCTVESDAMLAAGALLSPGKTVLHRQLWAGRPAKYMRDLSDEALIDMRERSEEHTSELQSLMRISYAVFCLKKKKKHTPY